MPLATRTCRMISSSTDAINAFNCLQHQQFPSQEIVYRGQIVRVQVPQYYYSVCEDDFQVLLERLSIGNNRVEVCNTSPSSKVIGRHSSVSKCCRIQRQSFPLTVIVGGSPGRDRVRKSSLPAATADPCKSCVSYSCKGNRTSRSPPYYGGAVILNRSRSEPDLLVNDAVGVRTGATGDAGCSSMQCGADTSNIRFRTSATTVDVDTGCRSCTPPGELEDELGCLPSPTSSANNRRVIVTPRTVVLKKNGGTFGFVLCGAKSQYESTSGTTFTPSTELPALQYFDSVEKGSVAEAAGLLAGDFLLEINGQKVAGASHVNTVQLIKQAGDTVCLKIITPSPLIHTGSRIRTHSASVSTDCQLPPRPLTVPRAPPARSTRLHGTTPLPGVVNGGELRSNDADSKVDVHRSQPTDSAINRSPNSPDNRPSSHRATTPAAAVAVGNGVMAAANEDNGVTSLRMLMQPSSSIAAEAAAAAVRRRNREIDRPSKLTQEPNVDRDRTPTPNSVMKISRRQELQDSSSKPQLLLLPPTTSVVDRAESAQQLTERRLLSPAPSPHHDRQAASNSRRLRGKIDVERGGHDIPVTNCKVPAIDHGKKMAPIRSADVVADIPPFPVEDRATNSIFRTSSVAGSSATPAVPPVPSRSCLRYEHASETSSPAHRQNRAPDVVESAKNAIAVDAAKETTPQRHQSVQPVPPPLPARGVSLASASAGVRQATRSAPAGTAAGQTCAVDNKGNAPIDVNSSPKQISDTVLSESTRAETLLPETLTTVNASTDDRFHIRKTLERIADKPQNSVEVAKNFASIDDGIAKIPTPHRLQHGDSIERELTGANDSSSKEQQQQRKRKAPLPPSTISLTSRSSSSATSATLESASTKLPSSSASRRPVHDADGGNESTRPPSNGNPPSTVTQKPRRPAPGVPPTSSPNSSAAEAVAGPEASRSMASRNRVHVTPARNGPKASDPDSGPAMIVGGSQSTQVPGSDSGGHGSFNFISIAECARQDYVKRKATAAKIALAVASEMKRSAEATTASQAAPVKMSADKIPLDKSIGDDVEQLNSTTSSPSDCETYRPMIKLQQLEKAAELQQQQQLELQHFDVKKSNAKIARSKVVVDRGKRPLLNSALTSTASSDVTAAVQLGTVSNNGNAMGPRSSSRMSLLSPPPGFSD